MAEDEGWHPPVHAKMPDSQNHTPHKEQSVHSKISAWQNKDKNQLPSYNTGTKYHGMLHMQEIAGHEGSYGKPKEGTKTEYRGKQAGVRISNEVVELCSIIKEFGCKWSGSSTAYVLSFGTLFEIYTRISNKLVGMLMRARKQGLIEFEGEMLFQRQDDHVMIKLVKFPDELMEDIERRRVELEHHARKDI